MEEIFATLVAFVVQIFEIAFHLDVHLANLTQQFGVWTYAILFLVIFAETGLVILPFLPGDSLLFAVGAVAALEGSALNVGAIIPILMGAAILGNVVNYAIGNYVGPKVFTSPSSKYLNKEHLKRAQDFYEKYGAAAIIITRFAPILRTFAPFVAGIAKMNYGKFFIYNFIGALLWVVSFTVAGYLFGNLPAVQKNFHFVIFGIIFVSALPAVITWVKSRRANAPNFESRP